MTDLFDASRLDTPRTAGEDTLANLLIQAFSPSNNRTNRLAGAVPFENLSLPQFGGSFGARATLGQNQAVQQANVSLGGVSGLRGDISGALGGLGDIAGGQDFLPPEISTALSNAPGMTELLRLAQGSGPGANLLRASTVSGDSKGLRGLASERGVSDTLQSFLNVTLPERNRLAGVAPDLSAAIASLTDIAGGAGGTDFDALAETLRSAGEAGTARGERDIREQFSTAGLRFGSDVTNETFRFRAEREAALDAELARLGITAASETGRNRVAAADILGRLGLGAAETDISAAGEAGRLGLGAADIGRQAAEGLTTAGLAERGQTGDLLSLILGADTGRLERLGTAGAELGRTATGAAGAAAQVGGGQLGILSSLFSGERGRQLSAATALPGAIGDLATTPLDVTGQAFNINEQGRQIQDTEGLRRQAEFQRTSAALLPVLLNFFAGAPQIVSPGIGQTILGAGAGAGAAAAGAK